MFEADGAVMWSAVSEYLSSRSMASAFDLQGDGSAETLYADEYNFFALDEDGETLYSMPRQSGTHIEIPVVADVDNDGSAEIVVVSSWNVEDPDNTTNNDPTVRVIRDRTECWIQARRIWNQHIYHVTNVREDGTSPQFESPSWESVNTFRANAALACDP